ncbi:MAG: hypothetical protein RLZZ455_1131 [Candidatus Parcubacteria bacterium]
MLLYSCVVKNSLFSTKYRSGFTLIELLVVVAVIGVLAGAIVAAVNPGEQFARGNDASRKSRVTQLGKAVEAYAIDSGGFPTADANWMQSLVNRGLLKTLVAAVSGNRACVGNIVNGFCYAGGGAATSYVYTYIQSSAEATKCSGGVGGASSTVYYVYDTSVGRACLKCASNYAAACNATQ